MFDIISIWLKVNFLFYHTNGSNTKLKAANQDNYVYTVYVPSDLNDVSFGSCSRNIIDDYPKQQQISRIVVIMDVKVIQQWILHIITF